MLPQHTNECRTAFQLANKSAEQHGSRYITGMHILIGVASAPGSASESLSACGVDLDELQRRVLQLQGNDQIRTQDIVAKAIQEVERLNHNHLDVGHVLLAMAADGDGDSATILQSMGVNLDELRDEIERRLSQPTFPLQKALIRFAEDLRVCELRAQIDDAQKQVEACVDQEDFESAALHRDKKAEVTRELEFLLERLWHETHG